MVLWGTTVSEWFESQGINTMRTIRRIALVLLAIGALGLSGCTSGVLELADEPSASPSVSAAHEPAETAASSSPQAETPEASEEQAAVEADDSTVGTACTDDAFGDSAVIPDVLADAGVPFYPCTVEMVAMPGTDPLFVGEYDTSHALIMVEMEITNQFDASDWTVSERTVEGDNAITHAQKPGYELVVVIGPSRTDAAAASVHYTLREQ